jgi:hypothetical protein
LNNPYSNYRAEAAAIFQQLDEDFYNTSEVDRCFNLSKLWNNTDSKRQQMSFDFVFPNGISFDHMLPVKSYKLPR